MSCQPLHRLALGAAAVLAFATSLELPAAGIYEPVELRRREPKDVIDTAYEFHAMFERRSLLYGQRDANAVVARIGREIAPPPTDDYIDYQFFVIRDPSPNAFAMPNGHVYVHTGMLARLEDSSQLAGLLAHEVNHVAGHHSLIQYRITAKKILIDIVGGGLAGLFGQLRHSRELEQEADDRAPALLAGTAYDPHAMPELFEMLAEDFEGLRPRIATIWTTHPEPEERAATSRAIVADLPRRGRDRSDYDAVFYPLRAMTVRDYIQADYPYTAIALAQRLLERYPNDPEFRLLLGDAWRTLGPRLSEFAPEDLSNREKWRNVRERMRRTREERAENLLETSEGRQAFETNLGYARAEYQKILDSDANYAPAYRGIGEVYEALEQPREAARFYLEYLQRAPDASDRSVIVSRLGAIRDQLQ